MKSGIYMLLFLFITTCSCNQQGASEREGKPPSSTEAPAQETVVAKQQIDTFNERVTGRKDHDTGVGSAAADNKEILTGVWLTPHAASVKIQFFADSTFIFNDYNSKLLKEEKLTGRVSLTGKTLTLIYKDRPRQIFTFEKGKGADPNYYLSRPGYYFVKGEQQ